MGMKEESLPLLEEVFQWARQVNPSQPITVGVWFDNKTLNQFQLSHLDVITFHNYNNADSLKHQIQHLKSYGRPLICTEYMRRPVSSFNTHLPGFKREHVGCYNWGLVSGKSQTIFPWGSKKDAPEPKRWFHDIMRKDGTPHDEQEAKLIRKLTGK